VNLARSSLDGPKTDTKLPGVKQIPMFGSVNWPLTKRRCGNAILYKPHSLEPDTEYFLGFGIGGGESRIPSSLQTTIMVMLSSWVTWLCMGGGSLMGDGWRDRAGMIVVPMFDKL